MALPIESPNRYKAMKPFSVAVVGIVVGCSAVRPKSTPKEVRSFLFCLRFQSAGAFSSLTSSPFFFYRSVGVGVCSGFWANLSEYFCCRRLLGKQSLFGYGKVYKPYKMSTFAPAIQYIIHLSILTCRFEISCSKF